MTKTGYIPTRPWHTRTCPEEGCIQWTYVLSTEDQPYGTQNGFPIYQRTIKWKCGRGHRSDMTRLVDVEGKPLNR